MSTVNQAAFAVEESARILYSLIAERPLHDALAMAVIVTASALHLAEHDPMANSRPTVGVAS